MNAAMDATRVRLEGLLDERDQIRKLHEDLIARATSREDKTFTEVEDAQLRGYKERAQQIDGEVGELHEALEREEAAANTSKIVRAHLAGRNGGGELDGEGKYAYRTFAAYARDSILSRADRASGENARVLNSIVESAGGKPAVEAARERLMRAPLHTTTSDIPGLLPPQHITQIMEVIDRTRPVVASARRVNLEKGQLTYPHVDQKPQVLLQPSEKTEGGTLDMQISMATVTAQTFIGGGNLSWQAINWSTPDALQLWFDFAAEAYAQKTEGTACAVLRACGTANRIGTADRIGTASTFADWLDGVVKGFSAVYSNSGALADTLYLSPDMFFLAAALTSDSGAVLISQGGLTLNTLSGNIAGVRVVTSRQFAASTAIVGDSSAFIVAETAGAPVELRAVEPAIGGLEVGVIGAMAAACYDSDRFSQIS